MDLLNFKTNIQLKSIIGKDLINDDNIAILELVKNSFDADAKKVEVRYLNLKNNDDKKVESYSENTSRLIIKDDGLGMDLSDIKDKWLNIAYSEKKTNNRQHNRMMAGAKGVGRFSCDRLGEYLNLYAKKNNSDKYILLKIDWKKFEIEDGKKEIQSVDLEYKFLTKEDLISRKLPVFEHGILLEIIKLRSNWVYETKDSKGIPTGWNTDKLVNLKKYLEKLINPNQAFEKNDFGIYLDAPEFIAENTQKEEHEKFIGKIENTIFEKLDFKTTSIESEIIDDGKTLFTTLKDKGQTIFWIKEKNEFFPEITDLKIFLYYLNTYSKAFFTKQTGVRSVDYGSIYLFVNGFRIPPYGEDGNDWLNLEQRKGQGYARFIGTRDLVGRIEILDFEKKFNVISNREGIEKNESYQRLTNQKSGYFFKVFKRLEKYIVDGLEWDSIPEEDRGRISEIEKKIISGQMKENDLVFREDDVTKKRRVYETIHSIIAAKADNVIELYINEDLILDKINEEKLNTEREFEQLIKDFDNKKIDGDTLSRILQKKAVENKDLEKQINDLSKYTTNDATTKAIVELQHYKETIERQTKIIEDLRFQLEKEKVEKEKQQQIIDELKAKTESAESKAQEETKKRVEAEKEVEKVKVEAEKEIKRQERQILFQRKAFSKDAEDLIEFHHIIGISAGTIDGHLINLKEDLNRGKTPTKEELIELIEDISYESKKIISITNLATVANFNAHADSTNADLTQSLIQYIEEAIIGVLRTRDGGKLNIEVINHASEFMCEFKPIEMAIVLDNLFSNSRKANAKNVQITFKTPQSDILEIHFKDNGVGVESKNQGKVFDFGFTTTSGSGLGLHHIQKIIKKYKGDIILSESNTNGSTFILIFRK